MKLLVALDGSAASDQALAKAIEIAKPTQAKMILLTAIEPLPTYMPSVIMPTGDWLTLDNLPDTEFSKRVVQAGQDTLERAQKTCAAHQVECQTRLEIGAPREVICAVARQEQPDILVMGSRGLGSLERLVLGSVSDYVVHNATCPVLVVR
jgi:Universal stress protein UspA and related nucleotide-binding proteins